MERCFHSLSLVIGMLNCSNEKTEKQREQAGETDRVHVNNEGSENKGEYVASFFCFMFKYLLFSIYKKHINGQQKRYPKCCKESNLENGFSKKPSKLRLKK